MWNEKDRKAPWQDWILPLFSMTMQRVLECGEGIWNSFSPVCRQGKKGGKWRESQMIPWLDPLLVIDYSVLFLAFGNKRSLCFLTPFMYLFLPNYMFTVISRKKKSYAKCIVYHKICHGTPLWKKPFLQTCLNV